MSGCMFFLLFAYSSGQCFDYITHGLRIVSSVGSLFIALQYSCKTSSSEGIICNVFVCCIAWRLQNPLKSIGLHSVCLVYYIITATKN